LAHGGVIAPATVTIGSTIMAAAFLRERLSTAHIIGAVLVITGIVLISWQGLHASPGSRTWIGDLLFVGSSLLWAGFTVLPRLWRLDALRAIAVVSVLSALVMIPGYLLFVGLPHPRALLIESVFFARRAAGRFARRSRHRRLQPRDPGAWGQPSGVVSGVDTGGIDFNRHSNFAGNSESRTDRRRGAGDGRIADGDWRFSTSSVACEVIDA
jgi:uncharacterized membrane protein SirB2